MSWSDVPGSEAYDGFSASVRAWATAKAQPEEVPGAAPTPAFFDSADAWADEGRLFPSTYAYESKGSFLRATGRMVQSQDDLETEARVSALAAAALEGYARSAHEPLPARLVERRHPSEFRNFPEKNESENS
jgi:lysozyme family protein